MSDISILDIALHGENIGKLTLLESDRSLFTFNESYIDDQNRPTLSLSFKDDMGSLKTLFQPTQTRAAPFLSNLLPEGTLRHYLAARAGVKEVREPYLLWALGRDLPGAVTVTSADGDAWPPPGGEEGDAEKARARRRNALRFSLAGVQLKFSALKNEGKHGGLTIPAEGRGGSWIVKLPAFNFSAVPENEFSMMTLAARMGMNVPDIDLVALDDIANLPSGLGELRGDRAFAIRRFDRSGAGPVHMEDFAQVFGVYPELKYEKASYRKIASVLAIETGEEDIREFVRRLVFMTLIGNADMHLKNWSLIYPDRRNAALAPAYDFVSTVPYLDEDGAALKYARVKNMAELTFDELAYMAARARLPEKPVLDTARDTVARFHDVWAREKKNLPAAKKVISAIDAHVAKLAIVGEG